MKIFTNISPEKIRKILLISGIFLLLFALLSALCLYFWKELSDPVFQENLKNKIASLGFEGWLIVLLIQIIQIIIAFIPGEPVEILAGALYATWGGLFTCLLGSLIASSLVFFIVRKFGYSLVKRLFPEKEIRKFNFSHNHKKIEIMTFILFLIPGTPKDLLTYLAGLSSINPRQFLIISTFARVPSIITSTAIGDSLIKGNFKITLWLFLTILIIGLLGIFLKDKILHHFRKFKN